MEEDTPNEKRLKAQIEAMQKDHEVKEAAFLEFFDKYVQGISCDFTSGYCGKRSRRVVCCFGCVWLCKGSHNCGLGAFPILLTTPSKCL
jgi:hypothetical protein